MKANLKVIDLHLKEAELLNQAASGDRAAQHRFYKAYAPWMLGICRSYISDLHFAEDVMISALMKVFGSAAQFRHEGSFEGWLRRITVHECISFLRRKKELRFLEDLNASQISGESAEEELGDWDAELMQQLIDALPGGYRTVFLMWAVEGYTHREIASILDISENTSKSQLFKARKTLQEGLLKFKKGENERSRIG